MGKVIGLLILTVGIWMGLEVFNNGVNGAFDGAFAQEGARVEQAQTVQDRAGTSVESAHAAGEERRARLLGE